ncbi:MAG: T9SS type A sorting domain-containing protein [candidate division Zixibacteria bacterium]|nr:T9SS type A sorting domain-containing protein [Candidatus Tariuqbacter arcticus]
MKSCILILLILPVFVLAEDYSLYFDTDSRVETPNSPELNPEYITVELWLKRGIPQPGDPDIQILLQKGENIGEQYAIFLDGGKPGICVQLISGQQNEYISESTLQPLIWHHLSLMYTTDPGFKIAINGILEGPVSVMWNLAGGDGMLFTGGDNSGNNYRGNIDEVRILEGGVYTGDFDPFTTTMNDILPFDQEIPGWLYGNEPGDHMEAYDENTLYAIIDGEAPVYLQNNFQYAIQQIYHGEIAAQTEDLRFWLTDQGDSASAASLYHDPFIASGEYQIINGLGDEARLDTSALFDYTVEMRYDRFYLSLIASKEYDPDFTEDLLIGFAENSWKAMIYLVMLEIDSSVALSYSFAEGSGVTAFDSSYYQNYGTVINPDWDQGCDFTYPFYIASAQANDGIVLQPGIDDDDLVRIRFNILLSEPPVITMGNIDSTLVLSGGHTWLSGNGSIGNINWVEGEDFDQYLDVILSTGGGAPTISPGDTISPAGIFNSTGKETESFAVIEGDFGLAGVEDNWSLPSEIHISPPYPNPFNSQTVFTLQLPGIQTVELEVFNLLGELVDYGTYQEISGEFNMKWDSGNLPSGLYFAQISTSGFQEMWKLVLIK